ncbi:MAG: nuclear transport factor 2 family protein [Pseudomonadota bacterium]
MNETDLFEPAKLYASGIDRRKFDRLRALFTPAATLVVGAREDGGAPNFVLEGIDQIEASMQVLNTYDSTFHQLGQQRIVAREGNEVLTETYCTAHHFHDKNGAPECFTMYIRYLDTLTEEAGTWRFVKRELYVDAEQGMPAESFI